MTQKAGFHTGGGNMGFPLKIKFPPRIFKFIKSINALKCESLACSAFCHENPETQPVSLTRKRAKTSKSPPRTQQPTIGRD